MDDRRNVATVSADDALRIVAVRDEASLDNFVALPWAIHARHPLWVPPLRSQDKALLTPGKHPFWNAARRELFLAMRGNEIAGRIAAIVDDNHNAYARERCGVFGFFECRNDRPAAHALFGAARDWLAGQGMVDTLLANLPMDGLAMKTLFAVGSLLPCVGIAILLKQVIAKPTDFLTFFFGFTLAAVMGCNLIACSAIACFFALINFNISTMKLKLASIGSGAVALSSDTDEEEEDI